MRMECIRPEFVEFIPDHLVDGVLYISERFRTCSHNCCCGCGEEVVTPLSSAEWAITREGSLVSLWPSVGNWNYACRSHYIIQKNRVKWAGTMTKKQIARVKQRDAADIAKLVKSTNSAKSNDEDLPISRPQSSTVPQAGKCSNATSEHIQNNNPLGIIRRLVRFLFGN